MNGEKFEEYDPTQRNTNILADWNAAKKSKLDKRLSSFRSEVGFMPSAAEQPSKKAERSELFTR